MTAEVFADGTPMRRLQFQLAELMLLVALACISVHMMMHVSEQERVREGMRKALISPDGKYLAESGGCGLVVYDIESRRLVLQQSIHANNLVFSPDSGYLAVGQGNGTLGIFDCNTWSSLGLQDTPPHHVSAIAWAPDGQYLYTSDLGSVRKWSFAGENLRVVWESPFSEGGRSRLAVSPSGELIAVGCAFAPIATRPSIAIELWDTKDGLPVAPAFAADDELVSDLAFSPDGLLLASSHFASETVNVWDTANGEKTYAVSGDLHTTSTLGGFSPSGQYLVSLIPRGLSFWDVRSGRETIRFHLPSGVKALATRFLPDQERLEIACSDGTIRTWDIMTARQLFLVSALTPYPGPIPWGTWLLFVAWLITWCGWACRRNQSPPPDPADSALAARLFLAVMASSCMVGCTLLALASNQHWSSNSRDIALLLCFMLVFLTLILGVFVYLRFPSIRRHFIYFMAGQLVVFVIFLVSASRVFVAIASA